MTMVASTGVGAKGQDAEKSPPVRSTAATLADLKVVWGGRDRRLRVGEVAEQLWPSARGGSTSSVRTASCRTCGSTTRFVFARRTIRVRPKDLEEFIAWKLTIAEARRPHRRKGPVE